ncbi:MAG: addiction module antidote protein, HigA family [Alphaproteobacteria bacterium]|nr:MAG: addiction module antidote protein, HigA family [Alphaproteobacteria bacterium]
MSIRREDLDAGRVDFADMISGRRLPPVHPGEILREEFLLPLGLSVYALAQAIKVPRSRLNDIVRGRRAVSADTALRLARYFGTSADFWLGLQARYDLDLAGRSLRRKIEREVSPRAA